MNLLQILKENWKKIFVYFSGYFFIATFEKLKLFFLSLLKLLIIKGTYWKIYLSFAIVFLFSYWFIKTEIFRFKNFKFKTIDKNNYQEWINLFFGGINLGVTMLLLYSYFLFFLELLGTKGQ
jgi:threonine/homoserine/homoserine lactone efflux protein